MNTFANLRDRALSRSISTTLGAICLSLTAISVDAAEEDPIIVIDNMPSDCSRNEDGTISCGNGLTVEEWCNIHGASAEDFCYGGSSGSGSGNGSGSGSGNGNGKDGGNDKEDPKKVCAEGGGTWVDGGCTYPQPETPPEDEVDETERLAEECLARGGTWRINHCDEGMDEDVKFPCTCGSNDQYVNYGDTTYPQCQAIDNAEPDVRCTWE